MLKLRFKARRSAAGPQDVSLLLSFLVFAISSQRVVQGGGEGYVCSRNSVYSNSGMETFRKAIGTKRKQKMKHRKSRHHRSSFAINDLGVGEE